MIDKYVNKDEELKVSHCEQCSSSEVNVTLEELPNGDGHGLKNSAKSRELSSFSDMITASLAEECATQIPQSSSDSSLPQTISADRMNEAGANTFQPKASLSLKEDRKSNDTPPTSRGSVASASASHDQVVTNRESGITCCASTSPPQELSSTTVSLTPHNDEQDEAVEIATKQQEQTTSGMKRHATTEHRVCGDSQKKQRSNTALTRISIPPPGEEASASASASSQYHHWHHFSCPAPILDISASNDKVVAQLAEELLGYASPSPSVVEASPIPLLTPPASPVSSSLEWPSNLAVDNALTAAACKLHPAPSLSSLTELEQDCDEHSREPFVHIVFPGNWHLQSY